MLARAGYAPAAKCLQAVLLDGIDAYERLATHREPYLKQQDMPVHERRRRLSRNLKRKGADLPADVLGSVTAFSLSLHGLNIPEGGDGTSGTATGTSEAHRGFGQYVSLGTARDAVSKASSTDLLEAYEQAGKVTQHQLRLFITMMNVLALPFLADRLSKKNKKSKPASEVIQSINLEDVLADMTVEDGHVTCSPGNPASLFRLFSTIVLVVAREHGEQIMKELTEPLSEYMNAIANFARQRDFPGADTFSWHQKEGLRA
jgi:hypothetical protein